MRQLSRYGSAVGVSIVLSATAFSQLNIPNIVQLPTQDFVWPWGETRPIDDPEEPEFTLQGVERSFRCTAKGTFKPGSEMRDVYATREFEQSLTGSIYFIQAVTEAFNSLYLSNDLQWAILDCKIPQTTEPEEETQERLDRALERAERERERRREREAQSEE
jgi:hypothetical protein